jgi:hypothetical protein
MTEAQIERPGPTAEFYAEWKGSALRSVVEQVEWVYRRRIDDRTDPSGVEWLNDLIKNGARGCGHIDNEMHREILGNSLSDSELEQFLVAYYWGSNYGFNKVVLPNTLRSSRNGLFRSYLKGIIREEMTPRSHWRIFEQFLATLGVQAGDMPPSAGTFIQRNSAGYQAELGHAVGYALAVEVESDFQLSLVAVALMERYPEQMAQTEFFDIHLDASGEEEHARATCQTIEAMIEAGEYQRSDIENGFRQAIRDTRDFMEAMRREVKGEDEFRRAG